MQTWKFRIDLFACGTGRFRLLRTVYGLHSHFLPQSSRQSARRVQEDPGEDGDDAGCKFDRRSGSHLWDRHVPGGRINFDQEFEGLVDDGRHAGSAGRVGKRVRRKDRLADVGGGRVALASTPTTSIS